MDRSHEIEEIPTLESNQVIFETKGNSTPEMNDLVNKINAYAGLFGQYSPKLKKLWLEEYERYNTYAEKVPDVLEKELLELLVAVQAEIGSGKG